MSIHTFIWELVLTLFFVLPFPSIIGEYLFYLFGLFQDRCTIICHDPKKTQNKTKKTQKFLFISFRILKSQGKITTHSFQI